MRRFFRLVDSGILTISTISVVQFLTLGKPLTFPLNVSIYGFTVSITLAGIQALLLTLEDKADLPSPNCLSYGSHAVLTAFAAGPFSLGMLYLFSYFSFWVGIVFAATSGVAFALVTFVESPWRGRRLRAVLRAVAWGTMISVTFVTVLLLSYHFPTNSLYRLVHELI